MATENNTQDEELLPPAEQIKRNQESLLAPPVVEPVVEPTAEPVSKPEITPTAEVTPPAEQIAQNEVEATGEPALLPPAQQVQQNQNAIAQPKPDAASVLPQRIQAFDPEKPDYFIQDYIKNLDSGKEIYEAHKTNPKIKWGVKQSMAMKDYMDSPESGEEGAILNAVKGVGEFLLKGVKGGAEFASDVFTPPETAEQAKEQFSKVVGDVATVGDVVAGVPLEFYQLASKIQEGGIQLADDLGIGIDPNNGTFTFTPKTKAEKLTNFMTRNDIDADRAIVNSKAPSNLGKILYYAGEVPTDSGQQSYAQLLRPLLASYLVPSVKQRMIDNPDLTEGEATQQWIKDSDTWGTKPLQDLAAKIPAEKENIAAAAMLALPQASTFGVALGGAGILGKGLMEMGRLAEIEALLPQAQAMTDTARTAATGGTFVVDAEGNITAAQTKTSGPRTKEQIREDFNNAEQMHADTLDRIEADNFERSGGKTIRLGPFNVPKPYVWAGSASDSANAAAEKLKSLATTGALATAIPATTGIIGAYRNRDNGLTGMAGGLLRGIEYGAAGELLGYGALKTAGKVAGVFSDLGKVSAGLQGSTGNVFDIAGNIPTSTKLTQNLFGGKIGSITAPTANWFANNLSQLAYQGVEAGALAAAMGILDSVPTEELPAEIASGMAMVLVPHMLSSAIHESPAARESRLNRENASINQVKQQASPESRKNAANISDYRNVVNLQKQIVADRTMDYRRMAVDQKAKPEDLQKAQELVKAEDEKLTEIMSANSQTRREYGRQNDLMWANLHRGLNGPLRSGQNNVGIEILTKDQILQKLVEKNKEYASTPQGMANLEHIASQDGFVINSAGGVELRAGDDLAEALKTTPIMFDPSMTTGIINADASMQNSAFRGAGMVEQLGHEGGHLYARTKEFQEANRQLLSEMFSTNTYNEDGSVAHEEAGYFSNQQMKDLLWNKYLKNRTDAEKKEWLASKGLWDTKNDKFIDRTALAYYREEIIADMANNVMKSRTMDSADGYLLRWAGINHSNNILARAIQGVLGVGGKHPFDPAFVSGAEFTPEMMAQTDRVMRQVEDYYGHIAPVIDAEPAVSITTKDMMKSKGLLKKYGITSGMFQTSVFGIVRNGRGEVVAKVPLANPTASEGTWVMDKATGRPKQAKGYDRLPDELDSIPVPDGGTLEVSREVAMQPDGETPILLSESEQKKGQKARRNFILNALGVTEVPETGVTWRGTFTPEQVENIKRLPEHIVPKAIKDVILQMNESLARGDGTRWIIDYSPTSGKKGKRKSLTMKPYDVVPIGMHLTKDGNFNITAISATRLFNKLHAWGAEFPHILDMWGGSKSDFFNEFTTKYLKNWQEGKAGETGLDPDPKIAMIKRGVFDNFLNLKDKDTDIMNQNWVYLKKQKGDLGPEGRDRTIMSIRADHVSSMIESSAQKIPVDYHKAKINAMPESGLPYEERPEDAPVRETAPAQEERLPTPFDGITAAYNPQGRAFGASYAAPQATAPDAPKTGIQFMPASAEIREKGSKQQLEFFDRVLENSGIKDKPNTMAALDKFIYQNVKEKYRGSNLNAPAQENTLFPRVDPEKIKSYYQKTVREATPEQAADFPPDWLRIRNMDQAEFDQSFDQDRVDQITQFRVNALAKSADYLLGEMKAPEQTELQKKITEINDALADGDIGLWEEKQAELEKLNGDTYENLRNQAYQGSYSPAEVAAILNASAKFRVNTRVNEDGEMTPVIQNITNGNEAVPNEVSGETASKIAEYMRMGMSSKDAYVKGLYDNMAARAKKRGVYTGWKKYDQSDDMADAETLNADCAGTGWCTGGSVGTANSHLSGGDFYLYFENGDPQVAIRTDNGTIAEVRGRGPSQNITSPKYDAEAEKFIVGADGPTGGTQYLNDRNFRKLAVEVMKTGVLPDEAYKYYNQNGNFISPKPQMSYSSEFEKEYTDVFRNAALDVILDSSGNLKTSLSYDEQDQDNLKYKTIAGDITGPSPMQYSKYDLNLPNLESVKGGIITNSAENLYLPKLKSVDFIFSRNAIDVDIKSLEKCNAIQLDQATSLIAPKLEEVSRVLRADEATQVDLRSLKKAGSIRLNQLMDKAKAVDLRNLEESESIDINIGYGGSLNLPKLRKADSFSAKTMGNAGGGEVYVPLLEAPKRTLIATSTLNSKGDVFIAKAENPPVPENFTWIDSDTGKTYKTKSMADFISLNLDFQGKPQKTRIHRRSHPTNWRHYLRRRTQAGGEGIAFLPYTPELPKTEARKEERTERLPASGAELTANLVASGTSLESFGKDTLVQLAESYGIDLPEGAKRGEIIDAINERPIAKEPVTENTKSITRQYGEYPKGTKVVVVGQKSKDPLDTNIRVQFPDGKVEKFPISWLKSDSAQGQSGNLQKLVKDQGRDAVNILLGEWDQNAVLNPDGTGIISAVDPRESMKKTKVPTSDFTEWLKGQDIEAILAEQGEEQPQGSASEIRFMPEERPEEKESLRLKMSKEALTDAALNQSSWKNWYKEHKDTIDDFFGDHAKLFQDILGVTSQASSVKANVGLALKAFGQLMRGEEFTGYLPAVVKNLNAIRDNTDVSGRKISNYKAANEGEVERVVVDRHIARLLFGVDTPSKAQYDKAELILTEIANELGWEPSQVQAALWAHSIVKSGKIPQSYGDYLKKLESTGGVIQRIGGTTYAGGRTPEPSGGRGRYSPAGEGKAGGEGIAFLPYSPELPKTEDGKVDWEGFKVKAQEIAKPLAGLSPLGGIRFMPEKLPVAQAGYDDTYLKKALKDGRDGKVKLTRPFRADEALPLLSQVPEITEVVEPDTFTWDRPANVVLYYHDGVPITFKYDPVMLEKPVFKDVAEEHSGQPVQLAMADAQTATGGDMGGILHNWLKVLRSVKIIDPLTGKNLIGKWANNEWKPAKNMKDKVRMFGAKTLLTYLMGLEAHGSNLRSVRRTSIEIDNSSMTPDEKDTFLLLANKGVKTARRAELKNAIEGAEGEVEKITKALNKTTDENKIHTLEIALRAANKTINDSQKKLADYKISDEEKNFARVVTNYKTAVSRFKNNTGTQANSQKAEKAYRDYLKSPAFKSLKKEIHGKHLIKLGSTFRSRKESVVALLGLTINGFNIDSILPATADFIQGRIHHILGSVELSENPRLGAVYLGDDPQQAKFMTPEEAKAAELFKASPDYVPHEAYTWLMLGPEEGNDFLNTNPKIAEEYFPDFRERYADTKETEKERQGILNATESNLNNTMRDQKAFALIMKKTKGKKK